MYLQLIYQHTSVLIQGCTARQTGRKPNLSTPEIVFFQRKTWVAVFDLEFHSKDNQKVI